MEVVMVHSREDVETAWAGLDHMYWSLPSNAVVRGARAAAEWTLGHTDLTPITRVAASPDTQRVRLESIEAGRSEFANTGVDDAAAQYARGADRWLLWWVDAAELPAWISACRPMRRRHAS